jgi:bla regulator protein blaR1
MISACASALGSGLVLHLADAAVRSLALACLAALALLWARRKVAALPLVVWRVVLYFALAMPLIAWLVPGLPLPLPATFSKQHELVVTPTSVMRSSLQTLGPIVFTTHAETVPGAPIPQDRRRDIPWKAVATATYLLIAGFFLSRLCLGWVLSGRLRRRSERITAHSTLAAMEGLAYPLGLRHVPELAGSSAVAAPVTLGIVRPLLLLPADWREWEAQKLRAVLAHELSHVARRDALTQMLAALHRCIFWFSPLGWWLERHLAELAEQASDDAALDAISDRNYYAEILMEFLGAVEGARGRILWQGVSMAKGTRAERRLNRILSGKSRVLARWGTSFWVGMVLVATPLACLLAAVQPEPPQRSSVASSSGATTINFAPMASSFNSSVARLAQDEPAPPAAPSPAAMPKPAPAPSAVPSPPKAPKAPATFHWANYNDDYKDAESLVIVSGDSLTMSGGPADARHAKSLQNKIAGDYIWFRHDGKGYIIRDAATVRQAQQFFAPQEALGRQQDELGKQQDELGRKMDEIGRKMDAVRINVPDLTAELKQIEAQLAKLQNGATMEQLGDVQSQLGELQAELGELQGNAGSQQSQLGRMQGELGRQQGQLGEQQGKLGEEQGRLAREAQRKMKTLLDDSLKTGKAQPE